MKIGWVYKKKSDQKKNIEKESEQKKTSEKENNQKKESEKETEKERETEKKDEEKEKGDLANEVILNSNKLNSVPHSTSVSLLQVHENVVPEKALWDGKAKIALANLRTNPSQEEGNDVSVGNALRMKDILMYFIILFWTDSIYKYIWGYSLYHCYIVLTVFTC